MDSILYGLKLAGIWYLVGLFLIIIPWITYALITDKEVELKVGDISFAFALALAGPLLICLAIIGLYEKIKENKDVVIWRNHKAKVQHILFQDDKDED